MPPAAPAPGHDGVAGLGSEPGAVTVTGSAAAAAPGHPRAMAEQEAA